MKAPDKIYLREFKDALSQVWSGIKPTEETVIASHEYIRKDALLEWAKELNEAYHKKYKESNYTCGEHWGQRVAFQRIIDKLNSM